MGATAVVHCPSSTVCLQVPAAAGYGVLVVVVAFAVGFLIGYRVRAKCQKKQRHKASDLENIENVIPENEFSYENSNEGQVNEENVAERPPALPPIRHPSIPIPDQTEHVKSPDTRNSETDAENHINDMSELPSDSPITEQRSGSANDISSLKRTKDNPHGSRLSSYIDSREIEPRVARIEESKSVVLEKHQGRQPTYLTLISGNMSVLEQTNNENAVL